LGLGEVVGSVWSSDICHCAACLCFWHTYGREVQAVHAWWRCVVRCLMGVCDPESKFTGLRGS